MTAKGRRRIRPRHRDTWTFGAPPPKVDPWPRRRRRSQITRRRRISGLTVALTVGYAAAALYGVNAIRSFTHVDVTVDGLAENAVLTSAQLAERSVRFAVKPAKQVARTQLLVDGVAVPEDAWKTHETSVWWNPGDLPEGRHRITLSVPRPGMGDARFHRGFVIDNTPPAINVPPLLDATGICDPVTVRGRVEPSSTLTLDGAPLRHDNGVFTLRYARPPSAPLQLVATDPAGNRSTMEVVVPVRYPGGQGVHATAAAWGYEPLRKGVLALVDAGLVSTVELDLKDEGGIIGWDSQNGLANRIGAVRPEYNLKETVTELKRRGVRVIGRVVAFRDAPLAKWAWDNGHRDWVVQAQGGKMLDTYGGFTNPGHPDVHRYNLDIAMEAADAGVDDILWDYVRRPEGDPATMVIPGVESSSDAVVRFLSMTGDALRERCVYQGASVFGIAADRPDAVGQDIPRIARHVDYIAPMLYPSHWVNGEYGVKNPNRQPFDIVKASLADFQVKMAGTGKDLVPWLQDFTLGVPYGAAEVRAQMDAAASLGVTDWLLWNAGATYTVGALDVSRVAVRR
ncbi:MAG: putative glycoside hydrolase [Actinomycetota bacterium]|nr:putative glycoside hydrolase [Actinomycetota bacterium]